VVKVDLVCGEVDLVCGKVDLVCGGSGFATTQGSSVRLEVLREWNVALQ
jgi:hypothetical protein